MQNGAMKERTLGTQGLRCSAIGLGCVGMSDVYGPAEPDECLAALHRAIELGITHFDTADLYGFGGNERLLGQGIRGRREGLIVATKVGNQRDPTTGAFIGVDGSPAYVRRACEASLERLGLDVVDLLYLHRVDPKVPVEESVGAMAELVRAGKVRYIGLSEASVQSIRRAHAVHPLSVVQSEFSLWTRDPELEVLPVLRELGIGFVAYSPLGRGLLTGTIRSSDDLPPRDYRRTFPRYQGANLDHNAVLVDAVTAIARKRGVTTSQLCLAWLLAQGDDVVPIPGTKRRKYVEENAAAGDLALDAAERGAIERAIPPEAVQGARFPAPAMERVNR